MSVTIVGVRHHSPACAAVVQQVLDEVQPQVVLIEGPCDMNGRIGELTGLAHRLPIALFHFVSSDMRATCFTPFCETSPEWTALTWAAKHHAEVRFMDLPSWSRDIYAGGANRGADRVEDRYGDAMRLLCAQLGMDGSDAVWDHLFEQADGSTTRQRLVRYFEELRPEGAAAALGDDAREEFMAQAIAWGHSQGEVVAVCGGFHAPALRRMWPDKPQAWPDLPHLEPGARTGSYVVPWSFERLDSFHGYAAGMPSPGWYQSLWDRGHEKTVSRTVQACITALRDHEHIVSVADRVQVEVQLAALASLRNHHVPSRNDVLDALCSALIKEPLDAPPPWTVRRGNLGTDPRLALLLTVLRGDRRGTVHPDTPRPPLALHIEQLLARVALTPQQTSRRVKLTLDKPADLERSRILHRLVLLEIPGFHRVSGPADPNASERVEQWDLKEEQLRLPATLEASLWGGTLEDAARARLLADLSAATGVATLAELLVKAWFVGLDTLVNDLLDAVRSAIQSERNPGDIGALMDLLLGLWRQGTVFSPKNHPALEQVLLLTWERGLWLFEEVRGGQADAGHQSLAIAIRNALAFAPLDAVSHQIAMAVCERRAVDGMAPPDIRGAAVGLRFAHGEEAADEAIHAVRSTAVASLGDWLAGLFAVTRPTLTALDDLLDALNERITEVPIEDFQEALPGLRLAFQYFPARERAELAEAILIRLGHSPAAHQLTAPIDVQAVQQALRVAAQAEETLQQWGLLR
jgi:hypothetical protein